MARRTKSKTTFTALSKKVAKQYAGKKVKPEYQKEYGKTYSKEEAQEVGNKVAATALIHDKMEVGGSIKNDSIKYALASQNRDGLLVKNDIGGHDVSTEIDFENEDDYKNSIILFDSELEAMKFIEDHDYFALTPVVYTEHDKMGEGGKVEMKTKKTRPTVQYKYGGEISSPRIYVVSLSDYNEGNSYGKWLDLSDYADGETVLEAIYEFLDEVRDEHGGGKREEFAIHDYEGFPSHYYSEHMSKENFDDVYAFIELAKTIPADAIEGYVDYGHSLDDIEEAYEGQYKNEEDFAQQFIADIGMPENPEYYIYVTDMDRRIIAVEQGDSYAEDIKHEDDGEKLIDEAGMDVEKYREETEEKREQMLDKAYEIVSERITKEWEEGLNDPYDFLVNEQGVYSTEDLLKASFIRFDYEKYAQDLLINDYFAIDKGYEQFYVFRRM